MSPRLRTHGVWVWLLGAVALSAVVALLVLFVPLAVVPSEGLTVDERLRAEHDIRTTLVQLAGGTILLFGTALTLYINREGQITERFTRAIDQLGETGEDQLDIRLGGIYALERIARESSRDRGPIVEVLTAFLRVHPQSPSGGSNNPAVDGGPGLRRARLRADFQGAASVLARNGWSQQHPFDLEGADLRNLKIRKALLQRANLIGAHLEGAYLMGAHLEGAYLIEAHLEGALLLRAHLEGAYLADARLEGANLFEAHLDEADLTGAHLEGAILRNASLVGTKLYGAHLRGADLEGAVGLAAPEQEASSRAEEKNAGENDPPPGSHHEAD